MTSPCRAVGVAGVAAAVCIGLAGAAQASVSCTYAGAPQHLMTVAITGTSEAALERRGDEIVAMQRQETPQPCAGGVPTVHNTDTVHVEFSRSDVREVQIRTAGGPFAPGVSPEADGAPEVEIEVGGDGLSADVIGTSGDDQFRWVAAGEFPGLNLNPGAGDHDADVAIVGDEDDLPPLLVADGMGGDDTIVADASRSRSGAVFWGAFAYGGSGDDVLGAFGGSSDLYGDGGDDDIAGSAEGDMLDGGAGEDRIAGKGGNDKINGGSGADRIAAERDATASRRWTARATGSPAAADATA